MNAPTQPLDVLTPDEAAFNDHLRSIGWRPARSVRVDGARIACWVPNQCHADPDGEVWIDPARRKGYYRHRGDHCASSFDLPEPKLEAVDPPAPLRAALSYAARGWPVFPCHTVRDGRCSCGDSDGKPGKHPRTKHGHNDATTDAGTIRGWWTQWPDANIGVALAPAGLLVVGPDSPQWLDEFKLRGLPKTAVADSGGGEGHLHYYYQRPEDCPTQRVCRTGEYDILTDGYAIFPPGAGIHGPRQWMEPLPPGALTTAPAWAVEMLKATASEQVRTEPRRCDAHEPPVCLGGSDRELWEGKHPVKKADGTVDRSETLWAIGRALARARATAPTIAKALAERDRALTLNKYTDRPEEYERIVDKVLAEPQETESLEQAIKRLAALPPLAYEQVRGKEAKRLDVRAATLDAEVCKQRGKAAEDTGQGQVMAFESPEPWPDTVDGAELLDELVATYRRYVVLPDHAVTVLTLWTAHTYAYDLGRVTPTLAITSPEKGCGKSTVMALLYRLASRPLPASNISPSALFRSVEQWRPALLIDEADSFLKDNEELRGILNSSHTRDLAYVIRTVGEDHEPKSFSTWAPKAIALIGKLPPTLHDRSIVVSMRRKTAAEQVARLRDLDGGSLQRKCVRWVADHSAAIRAADPELPPGLINRLADNWLPLLALADIAGGEWPSRVRQAIKALTADQEGDDSKGVMLLEDIRDLFAERSTDRLASADIALALAAMEERPWPEWRQDKSITTRQIAGLLRPFKIAPDSIRIASSTKTQKGYYLDHFTDAFDRYLPNDPEHRNKPRQSNTYTRSRSGTDDPCVPDKKLPNPLRDKECSCVPDRKGGMEQRKPFDPSPS